MPIQVPSWVPGWPCGSPRFRASFSPFVFSPLCLPVVSPHGGSTGLIPMQRVGVSIVFRQRARALVENESTKARGPAGPTWNPTWNLNGQPLDLVGENLFQQCGKFAEPLGSRLVCFGRLCKLTTLLK